VKIPQRAVRRRVTGDECDLFRYEKALNRSGFMTVAGIDEAGRGACAGPLVVGAAVFDVSSKRTARVLEGLTDSKLLTEQTREEMYDKIIKVAIAWSTVSIPPAEVDSLGLHVANIQGMRRALARLEIQIDYALTDGFAVSGLPVPNLGIWKGDQVCGCVSAASVLAKVTRDRMMRQLHERWPEYGFAEHKGYVTASHRAALAEHGATPEHRFCFEPVRRAMGLPSRRPVDSLEDPGSDSDLTERPESDQEVVA